MISDYVITEHDAKSARHAQDGIALASYPLDSHGVTLYVDDTGLLHRERGFYVGGFKAFPISYRSLRPKPGECENLLVVSCLSASHAAYGSVRMEPVFMMVGHAAGAAATLAINADSTVQNVPYEPLRDLLIKEKQILQQPGVPPKPQDQLIADVQKLVTMKITASGDDWLDNAQKGKNCDGLKVEHLLRPMARHFEPATTLPDALRILTARKVLASPAYWQEHATADRHCSGENVRTVIRNFVRLAQ